MQSVSFRSDIEEHEIRHSPDSVLVPGKLCDYYLKRCQQQGGRRAYFDYLAQEILPAVELYGKRLQATYEPRWKMRYQNAGQALEKYTFLSTAIYWEAFRCVAAGFGVSICFLFVFLLRLEHEGFFSGAKRKSSRDRSSYPDDRLDQDGLEYCESGSKIKLKARQKGLRLKAVHQKKRRGRPR